MNPRSDINFLQSYSAKCTLDSVLVRLAEKKTTIVINKPGEQRTDL